MLTFVRLASLFVILQLAESAPGNVPWKKWTFCKEVGPNENNPCLLKAVQAVDKDLMQGNSYFGTPSLDPLEIPELAVSQAGSGRSVAMDITFRNCQIKGFTKWQLKEIKSDFKNGKISGVVHFKEPVYFIADYEVSGKVILLPITGQGKANITLNDMTVGLAGHAEPMEKKGKKFLAVNKFTVDLKPKSMKINLENLFNGNKALGENMNNFLNENWEEVMKEIGEPISLGLGEAFKQISSRVFAKIPYDALSVK